MIGRRADAYIATCVLVPGIKGWALNTATPDNLTLGAQNVTYASAAASGLGILRDAKNWVIEIEDEVLCEALEVSLISFDVKTADGTVKLEWAAASETDSDYFEVERSANARSWKAIGRIEGARTVKSLSYYTLTDTSQLKGTSYYRLKIVDFAGKADYSHIRAVNSKTVPAPIIFPNPTTTSVTVLAKSDGKIRLYNLSGGQVLQIGGKTEKTLIPLSGLPAGAYIIKSEDGWSSKLIKN